VRRGRATTPTLPQLRPAPSLRKLLEQTPLTLDSEAGPRCHLGYLEQLTAAAAHTRTV
jgi:hypothetical protein